MVDHTFYTEGPDGRADLPVVNQYVPSLMRQLGSTQLTDWTPEGSSETTVIKPLRFLCSFSARKVAASIEEEIESSFRKREDKLFLGHILKPNAYDGLSAEELTVDSIVDLIYMLPPEYRQRGTFVISAKTERTVKNLKDSCGRFLHQAAPCWGVPGRLAGYPLFISSELDEEGEIAFGDWREAYLAVMSSNTKIYRDSRSRIGHVVFNAYRRVSGRVLNPDAAKVLRYGQK